LAATSDEESDQDHEAVTLEHPLRGPAVLVSLVAIAVIALAAGFLIEHESAKPTAEVSAADLGGSTAMKDLAQQRTIRQLEAINLNVLAAQADIKRVADELAALTARVDALEDVTSSIARQPNARAQAVTPASKKASLTPKSTAGNAVTP
jgi:hypothetical protein